MTPAMPPATSIRGTKRICRMIRVMIRVWRQPEGSFVGRGLYMWDQDSSALGQRLSGAMEKDGAPVLTPAVATPLQHLARGRMHYGSALHEGPQLRVVNRAV